MNKLDFVIVGGMKCGSTALGEYFRLHPDVNFCNMIETDYFSHNNMKIKSNEKYFNIFYDKNKDGLKGESSPTYSYLTNLPKTALKLKNNFPDIKIILIVRNPLKRIKSHFNHLKLNGLNVPRDLPSILEKYPDIIEKSKFGSIGKNYLDVFGKDRVLIIKFEEILDGKGLSKICNYLNVHTYINSLPEANKTDSRFVETSAVKYYKKHWYIINKFPGVKLIKKYVRNFFDKVFSKKLDNEEYVSLSGAEEAYLTNMLREDQEIFQETFDFELFELKK